MSAFLCFCTYSPVRFRFYQKYSDMQWAIDNFYLGPGCLENCRGHGDCLKEQCICDPGYSGPNCYLTQTLKVILLHILKSEFRYVFDWEKEVDHSGNWTLVPISMKIIKSISISFITFFNETGTAVSKNCFVRFYITLLNKAHSLLIHRLSLDKNHNCPWLLLIKSCRRIVFITKELTEAKNTRVLTFHCSTTFAGEKM